MPKLPRISGDEAIAALQRMGFVWIRQRGSHVVLKRQTPGGATGCVVPRHRELAAGTLRSILRQAKISEEDFVAHL
jgi:predicted RNA binding protein YcfA (HicA-like mRNA interferase family)